jgi:crossover junction endodeoxyribonuclease RuvC
VSGPRGTGPARVVGLDLSLTSTGVATITDPGTIEVEQLRTTATGYARFDYLVERIGKAVRGATLVVIEGPAYAVPAAQAGKAHERAGLWHYVGFDLWFHGTPVAVVVPMGRAKYATGNGRANKVAVLSEMRRRFPHLLIPGDDAADALALAAMGARYLGFPVDHVEPDTDADVKVERARTSAFNAVEWPSTRNRFPWANGARPDDDTIERTAS